MKIDNKTLLFFLFIFQLSPLCSQYGPDINEKSSLYDLPENMPLQTKLLWSENGLLRKTKLFNVDRPRELILRKNMLQLHQKLALGTLGLLFAQGYLGSKLKNGGSNYSKMSNNHALLGNIAIGKEVVLGCSTCCVGFSSHESTACANRSSMGESPAC